ncbi:MAG: GNAT family N-acyltransferase [Gammaproteobacteria bacterium]
MATPATIMAELHTEHAGTLTVSLADDHEVRDCQRLRYQVFADELGARLHTDRPGVDRDAFDPFCKHLLVRDSATGAVAATTRLLLDGDARRAGGFYSETEFDLQPVLGLPGRFMEVGRTCVHGHYRSGAAIAVLWSGVARMMVMHQVDYLIGCASIPLRDGGVYAQSVVERLRDSYFVPEELRVIPKRPLPAWDVPVRPDVALPALLKGYLRLGARVCGEPCWDPDFDVADLFVLLNRDRLEQRYARHFVNRL